MNDSPRDGTIIQVLVDGQWISDVFWHYPEGWWCYANQYQRGYFMPLSAYPGPTEWKYNDQ